MVKTETKQKILEVGAEIIRKKGYNNTGIQQILQAAGIPKGSFYFYFKNKQDFGMAVIDYYTEIIGSRFQTFFNDPQYDSITKLREFFKSHNEMFESENFEGGCPIGNLAQEMSDQDEIFRKKIEKTISLYLDASTKLIEEAKKEGTITTNYPAQSLAEFIFNSWEGAIIRMKVEKSLTPLIHFDKLVFEHLLQ